MHLGPRVPDEQMGGHGRSAVITLRLTLALVLTAAACATAQQAQSPPAEGEDRYVHPLTSRMVARTMPARMYELLEREGREDTALPEQVLNRMDLEDGFVVADLGAGSGFFTRRLARRLRPNGKVLAVDIQQEMLDVLMADARELSLDNIEPVLSDTTDPRLPKGGVDWVLMVDVYHEFSDPEIMLEKIKESLRPRTGRVALIEYRAEPALDLVERIPRDHKMSFEEVMTEWLAAGFELDVLYGFLPQQHFFVFKVAD